MSVLIIPPPTSPESYTAATVHSSTTTLTVTMARESYLSHDGLPTPGVTRRP